MQRLEGLYHKYYNTTNTNEEIKMDKEQEIKDRFYVEAATETIQTLRNHMSDSVPIDVAEDILDLSQRLLAALKERAALEAALRPPREKIANYLENYNSWRRGSHNDMPEPKELGKYLELAIEELRK